MDDNCDVCTRPTLDEIHVTFDSPHGGCRVLFCEECAAAVFKVMGDRYHEAIDANNANVEHLMRLLGIDTTQIMGGSRTEGEP